MKGFVDRSPFWKNIGTTITKRIKTTTLKDDENIKFYVQWKQNWEKKFFKPLSRLVTIIKKLKLSEFLYKNMVVWIFGYSRLNHPYS